MPSSPEAAARSGRKLRWLNCLSGRGVQAADLLLPGLIDAALLVQPSSGRSSATGLGWMQSMLQGTISLRAALAVLLSVALWRIILLASGVYASRPARSAFDYLWRWIIGLNSCALIAGLVELLLGIAGHPWHRVELFWALALAAMTLVRLAFLLMHRLHPPRRKNIVVVGSGPRAAHALAELETNTSFAYRLVGFIDSEPQGGFVPASMMLGGIDDLEKILRRSAVDEVLLALPMKSQYEAVGYAIAVCQMLGIHSHYFTDYFAESPEPGRPPSSGRLVLEIADGKKSISTSWISRFLFLSGR